MDDLEDDVLDDEDEDVADEEELPPFNPDYSIQRLTRDLLNASRTLSTDEARFLVDAYYSMQRDRIRAGHQERTLNQGGEPHTVMSWLAEQRGKLENQVRRALDAYSGALIAGVWARSITGIGPVIAAGLLANINIEKADTIGSVWRFAGLDPTVVWAKSTKRPWNGSLKRLCFLIGESFTKVSNMESDHYGKIYKARKEWEIERNERGVYAEQAAAALLAKKFGKDTQARKHYEAGHLPPARIHLRAQRYAVKLFLAHFHHVLWEIRYRTQPPKPYILSAQAHIAHPEFSTHTHFLEPPNWDRMRGALATMPPPEEGQPHGRMAPQEPSEPTTERAPHAVSGKKKAKKAKKAKKKEEKKEEKKEKKRGRPRKET